MPRTSLAFACVFALTAAPAFAEAKKDPAAEIEGLLNWRAAEMPKGPVLRQEIGQLEESKASKEKEKKLYEPQLQQLIKQAAIVGEEFKKLAADPDYQKHEKLLSAYKAKGCESPQARPQYEQCVREKALIDSIWRKPNVGPRHDDLDRARTSIRTQVAKIAPRHKQLSEEIPKDETAIKARRATYEQIRKNVERVDAILVKRCKDPDVLASPEALKHCHAIDFDGARRNLPPLTEAKPPFRATPN